MNRTLARVVLISAGLIWGFGFIVNKTILNNGWTDSELLFVRFFTATVAICLIYRKKLIHTINNSIDEIKKRKDNKEKDVESKPFKEEVYTNTILWGLFLGVFLYLGFFFQTWGLDNTTASNNALITAGYIVLMPLIIFAFERKHIHSKTIAAGVITLAGISFITVDFSDLSAGINFGDTLTFIGAFFYALHLYFLGKKTKQVDLFVLMAFQLILFSIIAFIVMIVKDGLPPVDFSDVVSVKFLVYAILIGFFASFLAFLFQSIGQKNTNEAEAAILISTESLFGPLFAIWLLGDPISWQFWLGLTLVLGGILLSELDLDFIKKKKVS